MKLVVDNTVEPLEPPSKEVLAITCSFCGKSKRLNPTLHFIAPDPQDDMPDVGSVTSVRRMH